MNDAERKRYHSLLVEIDVTPSVGVTALRRELEFTHGVVVSGARLRADLALLAEIGLLRWDGEVAVCTERGRDVARRRADLPEL